MEEDSDGNDDGQYLLVRTISINGDNPKPGSYARASFCMASRVSVRAP
jgi:hypothetical protein